MRLTAHREVPTCNMPELFCLFPFYHWFSDKKWEESVYDLYHKKFGNKNKNHDICTENVIFRMCDVLIKMHGNDNAEIEHIGINMCCHYNQ